MGVARNLKKLSQKFRGKSPSRIGGRRRKRGVTKRKRSPSPAPKVIPVELSDEQANQLGQITDRKVEERKRQRAGQTRSDPRQPAAKRAKTNPERILQPGQRGLNHG